jgi:hypothetical protein
MGGKVVGLSTIKRGTLFEELFTEDNNFNKLVLAMERGSATGCGVVRAN